MSVIQDEKIYRLCIKHIEKHSRDIPDWQHTVLGQLHDTPAVLQPGELPIVNIYFSPASWSVFTSRRVIGNYFGHAIDVKTEDISDTHVGNFKGYGGKSTEILTMRLPHDPECRLEYETGKASMAPIYYLRFWDKKIPALDKLAG